MTRVEENMTANSGFVRPAIDSDIPLIENWLKLHHNDSESLYVNWPTTVSEYKKHGMLVYEDSYTNAPVAYFWGSLNSTDSILEVRADFRGKGIGRSFVLELLKIAEASGEGLLRVDCAPSSSEEFWKKMGFDIEEGRHHSSAKRILHIARSIPSSAMPVSVVVRFFNERALYSQSVTPLAEYFPSAVRDKDGTIWLNAKLAHFYPGDDRDLVIYVEVDGKKIYFDKAKYDDARAIGVIDCKNGFALEKISLSIIS